MSVFNSYPKVKLIEKMNLTIDFFFFFFSFQYKKDKRGLPVPEHVDKRSKKGNSVQVVSFDDK